jgi:hypothetical protein
MGTQEIDPELGTRVVNLKEAHHRWGKRMIRTLMVWLIIGIVVGLITWFTQEPIEHDSILFGGVLGLGAGTFFIGCLLSRLLMPKPDTKCPKCGHDWKGSDADDDWLMWKCCPGCGLKMMEDVG